MLFVWMRFLAPIQCKCILMRKKMHKTWLDRIGMLLSIGCIVHCILLPFIIPFLPFLGFMFDHDSHFHLILSGAIVSIAAIALIPGYLKHKSKGPLASALIGITLIISMGIFEHFIEHPGILIATMIGSIFIILGHYFNHKFTCHCLHHEHGDH